MKKSLSIMAILFLSIIFVGASMMSVRADDRDRGRGGYQQQYHGKQSYQRGYQRGHYEKRHYYAAPVYAPPPVYYAPNPYPPPGINFVIPLHIH